MLTLNVLPFIAALYLCRNLSSRPVIVDALALNWLVCQTIVIANGGYARPDLFVAVDFVTAVFLAAYVQGRRARTISSLFIPMLVINGFRYVIPADTPPILTSSLDVLAWSQLVVAYIGGQNGALATMDFRFNPRRGLFARAFSAIWGRE